MKNVLGAATLLALTLAGPCVLAQSARPAEGDERTSGAEDRERQRARNPQRGSALRADERTEDPRAAGPAENSTARLQPVPAQTTDDIVPVPFVNVCPLALVGQMNGIYYYYARNCGDCSYTSISDTVPHIIDYDCMEPCTTGTEICHEMSGRAVETSARTGPVKLAEYVPRRGTKPGHSPDPDGKLYLTGIHISHRKNAHGDLISDEVVRVVKNSGDPRFFRVFALEVNLAGSKHPFSLGQEIDPNNPPPAHFGTYGSQTSDYKHMISVTIGGVDLEIPVITKEPW